MAGKIVLLSYVPNSRLTIVVAAPGMRSSIHAYGSSVLWSGWRGRRIGR